MRNSGSPQWIGQLRQLYSTTRQFDPAVVWWMLGAFLAVLLVSFVLGFVFGHPWYGLIMGVPLAVLAAMTILGRRAQRVMYTQAKGQTGAALYALKMVRRGWTVEEEPIAADPKTKDLVFRAVGKGGVVLVGEGTGRLSSLLEAERKKHARVLSGVPIHVYEIGTDEGQVPLDEVAKNVSKIKKTLTNDELGQVLKRLKAINPGRLPIPKGVDPTKVRVNRRAMRGR